MTENLRNLFDDISQKKLPYCRICFRTNEQRKLIVSEAYKKWLKNLNDVFPDGATDEKEVLLCTMCHRKVCASIRLIAMTKFGARCHKLYNLSCSASDLRDDFTLNYCYGQMKLNSVLFCKVRNATELTVTETLVVTGNRKETALILPAKPASVPDSQIVGNFNTVVPAPLVPSSVTVTPGDVDSVPKTPNDGTKLKELLLMDIDKTIEKQNKPNTDEIVISDEESDICTMQNAVIEAFRLPTNNTGENRPKVQRKKVQNSKAPLILRHGSEKITVTPCSGTLTIQPVKKLPEVLKATRMMGVRNSNGETSYYHVENMADNVLYIPALKARIVEGMLHYLTDVELKQMQNNKSHKQYENTNLTQYSHNISPKGVVTLSKKKRGASERKNTARKRRKKDVSDSLTSITTDGSTVRPKKKTDDVDWEAKIPMDVISYEEQKPKETSSNCPLGVISSVYSQRPDSPQLGTSVTN